MSNFREIVETESMLEFCGIYYCAFIFAKFKYFAKQIMYLESPDHALQNNMWYVYFLRV